MSTIIRVFSFPLFSLGLFFFFAHASKATTVVYSVSGDYFPASTCVVDQTADSIALGSIVGASIADNTPKGLIGSPITKDIALSACSAGIPITISATTAASTAGLPGNVYPLVINTNGSGPSAYLGFQVTPTMVTGITGAQDLNKALKNNGDAAKLGTMSATTGAITLSFQYFLVGDKGKKPTLAQSLGNSLNLVVNFA